MPTVTDRAIPLRVWDFSETSQTASLFCRSSGVLRGLAKGSKRPKGAFGGGIELLTAGEIVAIIKPAASLATLTEWDMQEVFWPARRSLAGHRAGLYVLDVLHHALTDADPHERLFDSALAALRGVHETDPARTGRALLAFQWAVLAETGYRPVLDEDARTGGGLDASASTYGFDAERGGVTADPGPGGGAWRLRAGTLAALRSAADADDPGEPFPDADPDDADRANRLLAAYLAHVLRRELPTAPLVFGS